MGAGRGGGTRRAWGMFGVRAETAGNTCHHCSEAHGRLSSVGALWALLVLVTVLMDLAVVYDALRLVIEMNRDDQ